MVKQLILTAIVLAASVSTAFATLIGSADLIDTVTVNPGTVSPTTYLSYYSGGNGATGSADGSFWISPAGVPTTALGTADHLWAQYDPAIIMVSATAINSVIAIPAIDHGWTVDNTGEFWEPFEFRIFGCTTPTSCSEEGTINTVWTKGVDDSGPLGGGGLPGRNADDWTSQWGFKSSYNYFAVVSGDRLVGGPYSAGEGEIDALAVGRSSVPEPASLLFLGLGLIGLAAWRWKQAA